jgi:hypothetical protein
MTAKAENKRLCPANLRKKKPGKAFTRQPTFDFREMWRWK